MKTSLRVLAAAAAFAIATPAFAQGGGGGGMGQMSPEQRLARQKEMLFQGITLSAAQSAKADTLIMQGMQKQMEAMQAARSGGGDMAASRGLENRTRSKSITGSPFILDLFFPQRGPIA